MDNNLDGIHDFVRGACFVISLPNRNIWSPMACKTFVNAL